MWEERKHIIYVHHKKRKYDTEMTIHYSSLFANTLTE